MERIQTRPRTSAREAPALPLIARLLRKGIAIGAELFVAWVRLRYRLSFPWRAKLKHLDHITIPCGDLKIAEDFYVGLLGARVAMRIDKKLLLRLGWSEEQIEKQHAAHVSLTLAGGPRIDLFEYLQGIPREQAVMHPHLALMASSAHFLEWKRRLEARGVITAGPTQPGPPGQASFYFNDPFGNHLEIVTMGFVGAELPVGVPDRSALNYRWLPE
jgi:catechol 2,3-dioxygenase-like lactoylglutathione lyase family enzyme